MAGPEIEVMDITKDVSKEECLYRCLAPIPFRKYRKRRDYLEAAIPGGFHKKVVSLHGDIVGQIEYAPAGASGYPIAGEGIIVMNCIWVLRRSKGHDLGRLLLHNMMESERDASGFATIGLEGRSWLRRDHMEWLGFRSIDSFEVKQKTKHPRKRFKIHLMWMPRTKYAKPPKWDRRKLLEGVSFCLAHPLYHPESSKIREILSEV